MIWSCLFCALVLLITRTTLLGNQKLAGRRKCGTYLLPAAVRVTISSLRLSMSICTRRYTRCGSQCSIFQLKMLSGFYTILLFPAAVVGVINVIYGLATLGDYTPAYVEFIFFFNAVFCEVLQEI